MDEENNLVELVDEEGNSQNFEFLMNIGFEDDEYVILIPQTSSKSEDFDSDEEEVVILRVEREEDGEEIYVSIEDEDEEDRVYEAFCELSL